MRKAKSSQSRSRHGHDYCLAAWLPSPPPLTVSQTVQPASIHSSTLCTLASISLRLLCQATTLIYGGFRLGAGHLTQHTHTHTRSSFWVFPKLLPFVLFVYPVKVSIRKGVTPRRFVSNSTTACRTCYSHAYKCNPTILCTQGISAAEHTHFALCTLQGIHLFHNCLCSHFMEFINLSAFHPLLTYFFPGRAGASACV